MTAEELYQEGLERLRHFYETAPYCGGIHSADYMRMIVEEHFIPAAEMGCTQAMKECGDYYSNVDQNKAIRFYMQYIHNCPGDTLTKAVLIAKYGFKLL